LPLGSRIRTRLVLECASREQMLACLRHLLASAGGSKLMTAELMATLCDHALGTYRVMTTMASELLSAAAQRELPQLDEKLYFELFAAARPAAAPREGLTVRIGSALPMSGPLPVRRAHELELWPEDRRWLIDELWAEQAVGIVGGEPKSCK